MNTPSLATLHKPILYAPLSCKEAAEASDLRGVKKQLHFCRSQLNFLERWQILHYKKDGFLAWLARFILKLLPSSQAQLNLIDRLENKLKILSHNKRHQPQDTKIPAISTLLLQQQKN